MAPSRQGDLFFDDEQSELFGDDARSPAYRADPDEVRAELHRLLAEGRGARTLPWEPRKARC